MDQKQVEQELKDYCIAAVKAMGFKRGSFHMEAWYTPKGPMLIECNPRVGGGLINDIHLAVFGVDLTVWRTDRTGS
jgi:carnosine synthase